MRDRRCTGVALFGSCGGGFLTGSPEGSWFDTSTSSILRAQDARIVLLDTTNLTSEFPVTCYGVSAGLSLRALRQAQCRLQRSNLLG
ncbi:MAG: hypothetical protein WBD99_09955 [Thermodesulfobacteriota bacterium]